LAKAFDAYYTTARDVAEGIITQDPAMDPEAVDRMAALLNTYRDDLATSRAAADERFGGTLAAAISASNRALLVGLLTGLFALLASLGFGLLVARRISASL